ncbi:MAG: hypothetical protein JXM69_08365 [Anaerolineae bacterium]|nr:hypothetical protein [Anaerolineae bacterium]
MSTMTNPGILNTHFNTSSLKLCKKLSEYIQWIQGFIFHFAAQAIDKLMPGMRHHLLTAIRVRRQDNQKRLDLLSTESLAKAGNRQPAASQRRTITGFQMNNAGFFILIKK